MTGGEPLEEGNTYFQGVLEVLKHFCSIPVTILMSRMTQASDKTKTNGRTFCILVRGTMPVKSTALGATEKEAREIKMSNISNIVASIPPVTSVIFPVRSTSVWDVLSNSFSFKQHYKKKYVVASSEITGH